MHQAVVVQFDLFNVIVKLNFEPFLFLRRDVLQSPNVEYFCIARNFSCIIALGILPLLLSHQNPIKSSKIAMVFGYEFFEHIKSNILRSELAKVGWETFYLERGIVRGRRYICS